MIRENIKPDKIYPILKLNYLCNFACTYCYYDGFNGRKRNKMPIDTAVVIMKKACEYNLQNGVNHIKFYWHGGEPTLNGLAFFKKLIDHQKTLVDNYKIDINNSIQTNGSLINENWIDFFVKNQFGVGVSIDGPSCINDFQRVTHSGNSTTEIVLKNIKGMMDAGIQVGVLSVITNRHQDATLMYDFYKENNIDGVGFCKSFVKKNNKVDEAQTVSNSNLASFMTDFYDLFFHETYRMNQREYEAIMRKVIGAPGNSVCTLGGRISCGMFATVNRDGDVYFCDDYDLLNDSVMGNILESSFDEIFETETFEQRKKEALTVHRDCVENCELASICGGGCPRHDIRTSNNSIQNYFCESFKSIIPHIENKVKRYSSNTKG